MNLPPAPAAYDRANEQQTRNALERAVGQAVSTDIAIAFLLMVDQDTGETGRLTINSGVITWTPV